MLSLPSGLSTLPSLTLAPAERPVVEPLWYGSALSCERMGTSSGASVDYGHTGGHVWASALGVPAVHMAFFNTVTRLDGSVLTTPSSPLCFPLLYFLSAGRPYPFSFPLEELGCLNSICCFPSLPFSPAVRWIYPFSKQ